MLTAGEYRRAVELSRAVQETAPAALSAVTSGCLAPVDRPRVREIVAAVGGRSVPKASALHQVGKIINQMRHRIVER